MDSISPFGSTSAAYLASVPSLASLESVTALLPAATSPTPTPAPDQIIFSSAATYAALNDPGTYSPASAGSVSQLAPFTPSAGSSTDPMAALFAGSSTLNLLTSVGSAALSYLNVQAPPPAPTLNATA
jgi:hypothetical protein